MADTRLVRSGIRRALGETYVSNCSGRWPEPGSTGRPYMIHSCPVAIAAKQRGLDYQVLEQGTLVNSIYNFPPQMVFFTTPELLEVGGIPFVSPFEKPTRAEALKYYRKVVDTFDLRIVFEERVVRVSVEPDEAPERTLFAVETQSSRGVRRVRHGRHVVFAIGYYDHPNLLNIPG